MQTYFKIEFDHPDYSPLDSMPWGMDRRYILASSDVEAQRIFRSRYPAYKDKVKSIEDTECSTLEEVAEWTRDSIKDIEAINIDNSVNQST